MIASYFSDKPYLTLIGLVWIFLGTIFIVSSFQLDRFDFKLRMLRSEVEQRRYATIVSLLQQIAGKKKIKTKNAIKVNGKRKAWTISFGHLLW